MTFSHTHQLSMPSVCLLHSHWPKIADKLQQHFKRYSSTQAGLVVVGVVSVVDAPCRRASEHVPFTVSQKLCASYLTTKGYKSYNEHRSSAQAYSCPAVTIYLHAPYSCGLGSAPELHTCADMQMNSPACLHRACPHTCADMQMNSPACLHRG